MNKLVLIPLTLLPACAPALAADSSDVTSTPTAAAPDKLGSARADIKANGNKFIAEAR